MNRCYNMYAAAKNVIDYFENGWGNIEFAYADYLLDELSKATYLLKEYIIEDISKHIENNENKGEFNE